VDEGQLDQHGAVRKELLLTMAEVEPTSEVAHGNSRCSSGNYDRIVRHLGASQPKMLDAEFDP
jgi:hypothetical protein